MITFPCFIFSMADENKAPSKVYEAETAWDYRCAVTELIRAGYDIEHILYIPMKHCYHLEFDTNYQTFDPSSF